MMDERLRSKLYSSLTRYFSELRFGQRKISDNASGVIEFLLAEGYEVTERPVAQGVPEPPVQRELPR